MFRYIKFILYFCEKYYNMTIEEKIELNKQIRKYEGTNSFVLSLQKTLKTSKYLSKEEHNGRSIKVLSEKQYDAAKSSME
jgi:hypothetical protein